MPLTAFQIEVARMLAAGRTPDSYLAGGAAILIDPNSKRYSNDLDYFHDSVERVATAFANDSATLAGAGLAVDVDMRQPGYIRAVVGRDAERTKVEWAHDSAWRFLPTVADELVGFRLHPVDLAINKVLALAGRDEARDLLDTLGMHRGTLTLGAMCWAAAGKDPGFSPWSLLELLRRRGKVRPEELARLHLVEPVSLPALKTDWLAALDSAERFIRSRPAEDVGCLYYSRSEARFVEPRSGDDSRPHFGRPGGVLPQIVEDGAADSPPS